MKKILGLTVAALLVMALVGGGTWAYFSDVETATGNQFYAGTLDLKVAGEDDPNVTAALISLDLTDMKPADEQIATIALSNAGTLEGNAKIKFTSVVGTSEGSKPEPETSDELESGPYVTEEIEVADIDNAQLFVKVEVTWDGSPVSLGIESVLDNNAYFDITELEDVSITLGDLGTIAGTPLDLVIKLTLDPDDQTRNVFQGDKVAFDLEFYLDQT